MNWKKHCCLLLVLTFITVLASGCGSKAAAPSVPAQVLRISVGSEPETLDPRKTVGLAEQQIIRQVFEGLITLNTKGEFVPGVAEKWEVSPDGIKYKFFLRANAKWSNGDPVTAHDFEYSWKTTLSPELASRQAQMMYPLKNAEAYNKRKATADEVGVKALDDRTLEVTLETPSAYFMSFVICPIYFPVNKKLASTNDKWASDVSTLIGNGPFKYSAWAHNSKIEMVKSDNYWDNNAVKLGKIEFVLSDSATTVINMLDNNQIDMSLISPPSQQIARLQKENKLVVSPFVAHYHYVFNTTKPPLDNVKVRKALAYALNRKAIVENLTRCGEPPALSWCAPYLPDATPGSEFRKVGGDYFKDHDVETAKKLLAEAGYPDGKGFPEITLLYNTDENHKAIAEAMQEMWKKNLGINIKPINQEFKVYMQARYSRNFELARRGWVGQYMDVMTAFETMLGGSSLNNSNWVNPEYDRLVNEAKITPDNKKRMELLHQAEKILMDDMPILPIYYYMQHNTVRTYVKNYYVDGIQQLYLKEAYIAKEK